MVPKVETPPASVLSNISVSPQSSPNIPVERSSLRRKSFLHAKSVSFKLTADSASENRVTGDDTDVKRQMRNEPSVQKEEELMNLCNCTQRLTDQQFARFCQLVADKTLDINYVDLSKLTPLLLICLMQESDQLYDCVNELLKRPDLDVNIRDSGTCWNALAMACRHHQSKNLLKSSDCCWKRISMST